MGADADLVRRITEDVFIGGDLAALDDLVAEDFVSHDPPPGLEGTRDGYKAAAATIASSFADPKMEFDDYIEAADGRIIENWAMTATHKSEAFGIPASGQPVRIRGMEIFRCSAGKVVEHWGAVDVSDVIGKAFGME